MKRADESSMTRAEFERSKERWYLIAGRPIKMAGSLLDRAQAGSVMVYGGMVITRDTKHADVDFNMEDDDGSTIKRRASRVLPLLIHTQQNVQNAVK